jgi:tetratricopeptide (TPR) repeat protein
MIDILKKRYKIGDTVTLHTSEASFTGVIDAFEDSCVILSTEEGDEFIANDTIIRMSIPKTTNTNKKEVSKKIETKQEEIKPITKEEVKTEQTQEILPKTEYKVGDKIPLEELEKRTDRKVKPKFPKTKGKGILLGSLSDLKELFLPEIEAENKNIVSANGTITKYFGDRNFGFITDKFGYDIWFGLNSIIDESLLQTLRGTVTRANIPILFTLTKNYKGDSAIHIHKPKTVEQVAELAKQYFEKEGKPDTALGLVEQILFSFPENYTAIKLKEEIEEKRIKQSTFKPSFKSYDLNYQRAKKLHNIEKNYEEALKYYLLALKNNEKKESCIKDIAMLYVSMGETEKAIEFIKKYENELPDSITTYNYLENFYGSVKDFDKVLEYIELLLDEKSVINDKRKNAMYLSKKGFALIQLDELDEAREELEKAISIHHENAYANRLLQALENPDRNELQNLINESEFNNYTGGISRIIRNSLDNCEYKGLKATSINEGFSKEFTKSHLNEVRKFINEAGAGRPIDRADALLTEARLLETIESNNEKDFYSVLARHCNAKALAFISGREHLDIVRFYYLEAFGLEESWDSVARQAGLYIWSLKANYSDLLSGNPPTFEELLNALEDREQVWNAIVNLFLSSNSIAAKLVERIYSNKTLKEKSLFFLQNQEIQVNQVNKIDDYISVWNEILEKRRLENNHWFASIISLTNSLSIDTLVSQYLSLGDNLKRNWLNQLDSVRLKDVNNVIEKLNDYLRKSVFDDKENEVRTTRQLIDSLIKEFTIKPTKLSFEGFVPLLDKIDILLEKSFLKVLEASTPKVKIKILSEDNPVEKGNLVPIQVSITNNPECSPIFESKISVIKNEDIEFFDGKNQHYDSIKGGTNFIFRLTLKVSEKIIKDKAATLDVVCEYKTRNQEEPVIVNEQLSLRLYSEDEFETIENPYAPIADGGPVTDRRMFYGRDEFINNRITAILNADSKQIIIYGQKRSGKSSVLHHLKQGLEATDKTFCISFSLGEIIRDLNEYTFYYKIIYGISRNLRLRKAKGDDIPEFLCPIEEEFKLKYPSNPANGFIELIEDFLIACSELENWKNRKLVVMIDEFTYLYTAIRSGSTSDTIMKQWKAITQNENAKFSVVLVGQDVVPSFKKEDYAKNAFGVIEDIRLTYLDIEDARKLIEEPILNKKNESRFIGRAVETIIDYTSRNPYYIQIFCARLVDYMNAKKIIRVTEADIKDVAETFIEGSQALAPEKFDNLIRAGEEHDFIEFDDEPVIKVLRQIAIGSKNIGICSRDNIFLNNKDLEDKILNHLVDREVLECKQGDNYKIQVKLFQEWLLRH